MRVDEKTIGSSAGKGKEMLDYRGEKKLTSKQRRVACPTVGDIHYRKQGATCQLSHCQRMC